MKRPTGVPPSVLIRDEIRDAMKLLRKYRRDVEWLKDNLAGIVKNAMEERATENGNITATFVAETVAAATATATAPIAQKMVEMEERIMARIGASSSVHTNGGVPASASLPERLEARLYPSYTYQDPHAAASKKHQSDWLVPSGFEMPSADLYSGWTRWLQGFPSYAILDGNGEQINAPVRPFRLMKKCNLPRRLRRSYDNNWKPIMELMEKEVEDEIRTRHVHDMDFEFFRSTYDKALKAIQEEYPEFASPKSTWKVSTYCRKLREINVSRKKEEDMNMV